MTFRFDLNKAEAATLRPSVPDEGAAFDRLRDAAQQIGLDPSRVVFQADGEIRRLPEAGRRGDDAGWYSVHVDLGVYHGVVGNWRTGETVSWASRESRGLPEGFEAARAARQQADALRQMELRRQMAQQASHMLAGLAPATREHPYLQRKGVGPHGALLRGDELVLPMTTVSGEVVSYQTITPDGTKRFAAGCTSKGVLRLGGPTEVAVICEGFATGASIHEATGLQVWVAFSASNMDDVIAEIAALQAEEGGRVMIAADHDPHGVGAREAEKAAAVIGGCDILMPERVGEDWNDVARRSPKELDAAFASARPLFMGWDIFDFSTIPPREWLYGKIYIRQFCTLTVAPGGLGKSTLVLAEAIAMATGREVLGVKPKERARVCYFNAEDPLDEIRRRVAAVLIHHGIDPRELVGWFFYQSGRVVDLELARGRDGEIVQATYDLLNGFVRRCRADVLILDPLANMHSAEETNEVYRRMSKRLSDMADARNMALHIVHHTKKLGGNEATVEDSRGGSALLGAVRAARVLNPMTEDDAARLGVEDKIDYFRVDAAGKDNLARSAEGADWYMRRGIAIGNGDWVASVEKWTPPDPFEGITPAMAREVQRRIDAMDAPPRASEQSPEWAGVVVADVIGADLSQKAAKRRVKAVLADWVKSGVLAVEKRRDDAVRRDVPVVVTGTNRM